MRTWSFSIASKRAQDHQNRSPDVKVVPVSVSRLQQFGLAGSSGFLPGSSGLFVKFITVAYSANRIIRLPTRIIRELPGSSGYVPGHPGIYFTTLYIDLPGSSGHCPDHPGIRPDHPGRSTTAGNGSIFFGGINIPLPLRGGLSTSSQMVPRTQVAPSHFSYTKS